LKNSDSGLFVILILNAGDAGEAWARGLNISCGCLNSAIFGFDKNHRELVAFLVSGSLVSFEIWRCFRAHCFFSEAASENLRPPRLRCATSKFSSNSPASELESSGVSGNMIGNLQTPLAIWILTIEINQTVAVKIVVGFRDHPSRSIPLRNINIIFF
jgi:hypothetical protein